MPKDVQLRVSIESQTLECWQGDTLLKTYSVSTSRFGIGTEEGSYKTPLGRFIICEKYGDQAPLHTTFKGRVAVGAWNPRDCCEDDLVVARILRLDGQDEENSNSYERFIYIHGTNHEEQIGTPASHGCVRMMNEDVIELFDLVPLNAEVLITRS